MGFLIKWEFWIWIIIYGLSWLYISMLVLYMYFFLYKGLYMKIKSIVNIFIMVNFIVEMNS